MALESTNRIKNILNVVNTKTGYIHLDLKSVIQYLCDCYGGSVGNDTLLKYDTNESFESVNTLKSALNKANEVSGKNHSNITNAVQTLCNGYTKQTPMYAFALTSDIHIQYATGYTDFQRAVAYFDRLGIPHFNCGDLTWAGTMVNANQYTNEWKGGLEDYKDIKGNSIIYAIGGNHETYIATYDVASGTWTSIGTDLDVDLFREMTGCEPYYTVSNNPADTTNHNVYDSRIPNTDVFIMLSIKRASAPNLWLDGEFEWLETTLERYKNKRCYVFFHEHDNEDLTADPFQIYPSGISEATAQGKAFIDLMRNYKNTIWFHGHTHTTFQEEYPPVATQTARGYKSINIPSLQGPRKWNATTGVFEGLGSESEAMIIDVYDNFLILKCLDMKTVNADGTGEARVMETYVLDTTLHEYANPIVSITATFTQGNTIINDTDDLNVLKSMLVVNGVHANGEISVIDDYTLSGVLTGGNNTITVNYLGFTATFIVVVTVVPKITNQIPISTDTKGNIYNGKGYKEDTRIGSAGTDSSQAGFDVVGFIPCKIGDVYRFDKCTINPNASSNCRIFFYTTAKVKIGYITLTTGSSQTWTRTYDSNNNLTSFTVDEPSSVGSSLDFSNLGYIRFVGQNFDENSIITINQEIA